MQRCVHGMDSRFCAVCNRSGPRQKPGSADATIADILQFLNQARVRATYGAVAHVLGVPPQSIGAILGTRRPEASWIVSGETGLPSDYEQAEWHPDLLATPSVIRTGSELTLRLSLWRARAR